MLPSDIACRRCAQQPGEPCIRADGSPCIVSGKPYFHGERFLDAESMDVQGANVSKEEFKQAIDNTGLI